MSARAPQSSRAAHGSRPARPTAPRPRRSAGSVALGTFLVLAAGALLLVIAAGDQVPLWVIGAWFVIALACALLVGALVPPGAARPARSAGEGPRRGDRERDDGAAATDPGAPVD